MSHITLAGQQGRIANAGYSWADYVYHLSSHLYVSDYSGDGTAVPDLVGVKPALTLKRTAVMTHNSGFVAPVDADYPYVISASAWSAFDTTNGLSFAFTVRPSSMPAGGANIARLGGCSTYGVSGENNGTNWRLKYGGLLGGLYRYAYSPYIYGVDTVYHVVANIDSDGKHVVNVDGGTVISGTVLDVYKPTTASAYMALYHSLYGQWRGVIDNIMVWPRGLTPAEMTSIYVWVSTLRGL